MYAGQVDGIGSIRANELCKGQLSLAVGHKKKPMEPSRAARPRQFTGYEEGPYG
jgi:hypothetical protein